MADLHIERLALTLPGFSPDEGQRLARLVTDGLAAAALDIPGRSTPSLKLDVAMQPGESLSRLAERIVAELRRQI
jgi:hypothetical protein